MGYSILLVSPYLGRCLLLVLTNLMLVRVCWLGHDVPRGKPGKIPEARKAMGKRRDNCEPDGELSARELQREFGNAFPRLGPTHATAFKCLHCGFRFPVPGLGGVATKQANTWWRKKHPLCVRGLDPVRACTACTALVKHFARTSTRGRAAPTSHTSALRPCTIQKHAVVV